MTQIEDIAGAGRVARPAEVRVWDLFVRIFHWSLVGLFFFAFVTGDDWGQVHLWAGYAVAALVVVRIVWGFIGSRHARFSDFVHRPATVIAFLRDAVCLRARRHVGHNPAGGAMILAMFIMIAAITATGYMMTTDAFWGVEWVEELHEVVVYMMLLMVGLHVAGVILASIEHGENLVRSMFTGNKRPE